MNILVIGNGFDLAHGLPTKYQDFLEFIAFFKKKFISNYDKIESYIPYGNEKHYEKYRDYFEKDIEKLVRNEFLSLIDNNLWFDHFDKAFKNNLKNKQNWLDFEAEISYVIQELDRIRKEIIKENINHNPNAIVTVESKCDILIHEKLDETSHTINQKFTMKRIKDLKEKLLKDLDRLTRCLELYFSDFIKYDKCPQKELFSKMLPVHVLNFNYTNTFNQVYKKINKNEVNSANNYIHGRARTKKESELNKEANTVFKDMIAKEIKENNRKINKIELEEKLKEKLDEKNTKKYYEEFVKEYKTSTCNLVLGIEEYLTNEDKDKDNEFIEFKKFYQRIYKGTGDNYKTWLNKGKNINTFIYGHSLATTDGDIIKDLIRGSKLTTIYYHSKNALHDIILNLVQIIGEDELIARTAADNKSISFKQA